jgi:flagellin
MGGFLHLGKQRIQGESLMTVQLHNASLSLAYNGIQAAKEVEKSVAKLASGKKHLHAGDDVGGFKQSVRIGNEQNLNSLNLQNIQNLISYSQTQEDALHQAGKVLQRMNSLTQLALDVTKTDVDRANYNHEFAELAGELEAIKGLKLNDLDLFTDGPFSEEKRQFIQVLQSQWLKAAEQVVEDRIGLTGKGQDTFKITVNDEGTQNYMISLSWNYTNPNAPDKQVDVSGMSFEIYNYNLPVEGPSNDGPSYIYDRLNSTMLSYAILAENLYFNALANGDINKGGGKSGGGEWFKSGVSDFVHGGDLLMGSFDQSLVDAIGTGDDQAASLQQRASDYVAVRYLHEELKSSATGLSSNGIKDMLAWMANQVQTGKSASASSIGAALAHFIPAKYNDVATANDEFVADYVANGYGAMASKIILKDYNPYDPTSDPRGYFDTGAIGGFDADGGPVIDSKNAVPDSGVGYDSVPATENATSGFKLAWEKEGKELFTFDPSGISLIFEAANSVTIEDTHSYNLKSINSANLSLNLMDGWLERVSKERARVAANTKRLFTERERFEGKFNSQQSALERIADTDFAEESTTLAKNQIRTQASIAILAQGQESSVSLRKLLAGIQTKSKRTNSAPTTS